MRACGGYRIIDCLVCMRIADNENLERVREDNPPVLPLVRTGFDYLLHLFLPNRHFCIFAASFFSFSLRRDTESEIRNRWNLDSTARPLACYFSLWLMNGKIWILRDTNEILSRVAGVSNPLSVDEDLLC